jgi:NRPS condensation-like uncharacterized protein
MQYHHRLLGAFEKLLWMLDQHIPTHFVMAAEIEGRAELQDWHSAFLTLQQKHPLFSVSITADEHTGVRFNHLAHLPIPLRVVQDFQAEQFNAELEKELASAFTTAQSPLVRAVLLKEGNRSILIFSVHHAIGDGISLVLVFKDLLKSLNHEKIGLLPMPPAIDDILGLTTGDQDNRHRAAASFADQQTTKQERMATVSPAVSRILFDQAFTESLLHYCRRENTTVYAALSAALIIAARQLYQDGSEKTIRFITPISIRETLNLPEGSSLCITNKFIVMAPTPTSDFWETARYIKAELAGTKSLEYIQAGTEAFRGLTFSDAFTVKAAATMMENEFDHEFIISNVGVTPYETEFGALKLDTIWGPMQFNGNPIEHSVGIATTNGKMAVTYASRAPLHGLLPLMKEILTQTHTLV